MIRIMDDGDTYTGNLHDWKKANTRAVKMLIRTTQTKEVKHKTWTEISNWREEIENMDNELLCEYWKMRRHPLLSEKVNVRRIIEQECTTRFKGFQAAEIKVYACRL